MPKDEEEDLWTRRINAFWSGFVELARALGPIIASLAGICTLILQWHTGNKIDDAKVQVTEVASKAAEHAEKAATATKAVKTELDRSIEERRDQFNEIAQKQDADLKNWHAYNTKEPEDMNKAQQALQAALPYKDDSLPNLKTLPPEFNP